MTRSPNPNNDRLEEQDRFVERPSPKGNGELFNPKGGRQQVGANGSGAAEAHGDQETTLDALVDQVEGLSLIGVNGTEMPLTASPTPATPPNKEA